MGAEALAEAASEAEASEVAHMAVEDTAEEALGVVREDRVAHILDGALARALAAGIADRITAADALAACLGL